VKNRLSITAIGIIAIVLILFRVSYPKEQGEALKLTKWDAFGYYMYNPSIFIYGDVSELKWVTEIDSTYELTGGEFYQATKLDNGNYVNKYLGGVAIMQLPFFLGGHLYASLSSYPADGFSAPYQWAIAISALFYCLFGFFILRQVLIRYFDDWVVAITLLFLALGTNLIQYVAIDGAQSHIYIFPLYALILYFTIKWHESPNWKWAALIGAAIGLATICRPTELIMLFIPLLWNTHTKEEKQKKWQLVRENRKHFYVVLIFGLIGILPQLIYWKVTSGDFVYNVGSKWFFFNPWFRVLFGIDNGFFIYTPLTILFVLGFFFMKKYSFQRSVLVFGLLNIWIIMAWSDWRYGATFSTRAMVQSYPVYALGLAAFIHWTWRRNFAKYTTLLFGLYMMVVNLFQIGQYNALIINYRDMSWAYYGRIYLNPTPSALDMSLLDGDDFIYDEREFKKKTIYNKPELGEFQFQDHKGSYLKVEARINTTKGFDSNVLQIEVGKKKTAKVRLHNPIAKRGDANDYAFYIKIPEKVKSNLALISIYGAESFEGEIEMLKVTQFY